MKVNWQSGVLRAFAYSCWTIWAFVLLCLVFDQSDRYLNRNAVFAILVTVAAPWVGLVAFGNARELEKKAAGLSEGEVSFAHPAAPSKLPPPHASIR